MGSSELLYWKFCSRPVIHNFLYNTWIILSAWILNNSITRVSAHGILRCVETPLTEFLRIPCTETPEKKFLRFPCKWCSTVLCDEVSGLPDAETSVLGSCVQRYSSVPYREQIMSFLRCCAQRCSTVLKFLAHRVRENSNNGVSEDPVCRNSGSEVFEVPVRSAAPLCLIGNEVSYAPGA